MMAGYDEIKRTVSGVVASSRQYPFLFVGSGLSRRYLGSPDWAGLLRAISEEALGDPYAYARFASHARSNLKLSTLDEDSASLLPEVASLMEGEVNDSLLSLDRFDVFRADHEEELTSAAVSPMKMLISDRLSNLKPSPCKELDLLAQIGAGKISGVITTNYDCLCERLFPDFDVKVGERGMIFHESSFAQELYKIHGSVEEPDSLILTSADYRAFNDGKDYLVAKLLTIFLEFPVIFLGYSIQDANVRDILASVARCVGQRRMNEMKSRMLFIKYAPGESRIGGISFSFNGLAMEMTCIETDDFSPIYEAIGAAKKTFPLKLVRELKGNVYRLAAQIDPSSDVVVSGLDGILSSPDASKRVVIGVAKFSGEIGYPLYPEDVFRDVVLDDLCYDPKDIERHYLNSFVKRLANAVPVFKYASALGWSGLGPAVSALIDKRTSLESFRTETLKKARAKFIQREQSKDVLSVDGMIKKYGFDSAYKKMGILNEGEISVSDLGSYLADLLRRNEGKSLLRDSNFRKMVIIYDFMKYRYGKSPDLNH